MMVPQDVRVTLEAIAHNQEPMSRSLPLSYKPYDSTFARTFLFLERHEF